jgi:general secretion pathway protein G
MVNRLRNKFKLLTSGFSSHSFARGFTLIELLIVISLIGVLSSVLIVLINPVAQFQRARDAQRKADIRQIQSALEMYRSDVGSYPPDAALSACNVSLANAGITYMAKIPCDPKTGWVTGNAYDYTPTGAPPATYTLNTCLENKSDPQATGAVCSTTGKIFSVSNP